MARPGRRIAVHGPSTYSIVAADPVAGQVGVAVQSKFLAVGSLVPHARGGVGALATQAIANVRFGPAGLDLLERGHGARATLDRLLADDDRPHNRQVMLVDAGGDAAAHTGDECIDPKAHVVGNGWAASGNIIRSTDVPQAMGEAFLEADGPLWLRLIEALQAGEDAGGELRGMEAAAIIVAEPDAGYGGNNDRYIDLRVDHAVDPIAELRTLLGLRELYFGRTHPSQWLPLAGTLVGEVRGLLGLEPTDDLPDALFVHVGWENMEERWAGPDHIDPVVLGHLRAQQRRALGG